MDYFHGMFSTTSPSEFQSFMDEITPSITPQMNQRLFRIAAEDEVRRGLFMTLPEKAFGPDGMTTLFFHNSLHIIIKDILDMVDFFFTTGKLDTRLNITNFA